MVRELSSVDIAFGLLGQQRPQPGIRRPLMVGEDDAPPIPRDATVVSGLDGETASAVAAAFAADRRRTVAKPVEEPVVEKPETNTQRINREHAERMAQIAKVQADLFALARKRGVDPHAPVDPAPAKSDRKELIDRVSAAAEERRAKKAREKAVRKLAKMGL